MLTRGTLLLTLLLLAPFAAAAEGKIGFINSEAIMQALPEAQDAQRGLDALVTQWEGELQKMQDDWKRKFEDYDRKKLILTEQSRAEQERTLRELDQSIVEFRNRKFGQNGELFTKQNEVMKPIQNKLFKVLEEIAVEDGFDYIVDRSGEVLILYANAKLDLTSKALQRMQTFGR
jgi:outer membrane protein